MIICKGDLHHLENGGDPYFYALGLERVLKPESCVQSANMVNL